jgi:hypothetical protein
LSARRQRRLKQKPCRLLAVIDKAFYSVKFDLKEMFLLDGGGDQQSYARFPQFGNGNKHQAVDAGGA